MNNLLTFDIEDNFTYEELVDPGDWGKYEGQVVKNTHRILDLLEQNETEATFFVLGKVAERRPEVVEMIMKKKHEIATHGYIHRPVKILGKNGFLEDLTRSKKVIEALTGRPLKGHRAMASSVNIETVWALEVISAQGFLYDSSIKSSHFDKHSETFSEYFDHTFFEFAPSTICMGRRDIAFGGGIIFRAAPYSLICSLIRKENNAGRPVVVYAHAWEFNKDQPKRKVPLLQTIAQSPLAFTTYNRLQSLLKDFTFTSIENHIGVKE